MYRVLIATLGFVAVGVTVAVTSAIAGDGPLPDELREVRAAVARYHSTEQAASAGYFFDPTEPCIASPLGTMGLHIVNEELMADPAIDSLEPEILLYVPKDNGRLEFVGVEYFRRAADQTPPIDASDRPSLFGVEFQGPMPEHAPGMGWHYDLHVWVAEANPSGVFALFNPELACS
jgi:hypothetical protein